MLLVVVVDFTCGVDGGEDMWNTGLKKEQKKNTG